MNTWRANAGRVTCLGLLSLVLATGVFAKKIPPAEPVDINSATVKELEELPGVGPTTAKAIVEFRAKSGRFRRVNDLLVIRGLSEAKLKRMRPYITVGPAPNAAVKPNPAGNSAAKPNPPVNASAH